ncbi:MAG TPA: S8 family serine peptidase, partial [Verrucomicrobiae bacterium]|nr:S8 family serine peptidase [Verrucomicrobiae bacterium]
SGRIIVGLVDTAVQPLGDGLDSFLLKQLSAVPSADLDPAVPTHGTAMAETILQGIESVTGSGTSVQIQPVNVFPDPDGSTTTFDVLQGMVLAFNSGSKIINLSLGGTEETDAMRDLIDTLAKKDVLVVGAKGNEPTTEPFFPAAYDTVLAVTALEPNGEVAPYANRAPVPALGAPGTSIVYYQRQGWAVSGTSPAAADVSGMAAGYMDKNAASTKQARAWLEQRLPNE